MNLTREYKKYVENLTDKHFDWLIAKGMPRSTLFSGASVIGIERVETHIDGTWCTSPSGRPALTIPVGCRGPKNIMWQEITDLVAVYPNKPEKWFFRTNLGTILGEEQFDYAPQYGQPVLLVSNPMEWLKAESHAVCILDWQAIHAPFWFEGQKVLCDTPQLAQRLKHALKPAQPRVSIRVLEQEHAV